METYRLTFDIATSLDPSILLELLHEHAAALADDIGSQHDGRVRSGADDIEQSCCVEPVPTMPPEPVTVRIQRIVDARDYCADHGVYPAFPNGPQTEGPCQQGFDDWAADVAASARPAGSREVPPHLQGTAQRGRNRAGPATTGAQVTPTRP